MGGSGESRKGRTREIASTVDALLAAIAKQSPLMVSPFNAGCTDDALERLEKTLGVTLPADYRQFLRLHNGQSERQAFAFPPDQLVFLSVTRVASLWAELQAYGDDRFFDELREEGRVRAVLYHKGRIPIAQNELATAYLWLDLVPGPKGRMGQLVFNVNEVDCVVVENSVGELFERYLRFVETARMTVEEQPPSRGEGYWCVADGRYVDWIVYRELRAADEATG